MVQRHVEDVDAERLLVSGCEFDRLDHVARVAGTVRTQDFEANQARRPGDADVLSVGPGAGTGNQARDVRAVAVAVRRRRGDRRAAAGEVIERTDASGEIGGRCDARVNDGDAYATAAIRSRDAERRLQVLAVNAI